MDIESTHYELKQSACIGQDGPGEQDRGALAKLGVGFDGRYYRYGAYRYERCADAVNYARLESSRPGYQGCNRPPALWLKRRTPTDAEQHKMSEFAIAFDGQAYCFKGYRYERLADAVNYARLRR